MSENKESVGKKAHIKSPDLDDKLISRLKKFAAKNNIAHSDAKRIFSEQVAERIFPETGMIPVEIFISRLGALESIVKYLKENLCLSIKEISGIISRNQKTVWSAYSKSRKKHPARFMFKPTVMIPLGVINNRNLGVQESIVLYLKDVKGLSYHDIAMLLKRNDRTIWTAYSRARKKQRTEDETENRKIS